MEGIYKDKSKHCIIIVSTHPEKPRVLLLGPDTGVSALTGGRITINSGYGIKPEQSYFEVALRNRLSGVRLLIIDELYMESNDL